MTAQPWYEGGYRANVVAYAIAKLAYDAQERNQAVDLDSVWKKQAISPTLREALQLAPRQLTT